MTRWTACLACLLATPALAADCAVSTAGLALGAYDPFSAAVSDGAGSITVTCSVATSYNVALSTGRSGAYAVRRMAGPGAGLAYNLYLDASRNTVWGDGSAATGMLAATAAVGHHTVYGRIGARQNAPAGAYADTVVITVSY